MQPYEHLHLYIYIYIDIISYSILFCLYSILLLSLIYVPFVGQREMIGDFGSRSDSEPKIFKLVLMGHGTTVEKWRHPKINYCYHHYP